MQCRCIQWGVVVERERCDRTAPQESPQTLALFSSVGY
jgi:hypothetical protein